MALCREGVQVLQEQRDLRAVRRASEWSMKIRVNYIFFTQIRTHNRIRSVR